MSKIALEAYLFFTGGKCREAMEFYKDIFGGELTIQTYGEVPAPGDQPEEMKGMEDRIMHASLRNDDIHLMASDSTRSEPFGESFITLSLSGTDEERLRDLFNKLAEGGTVVQPLEKQFWGSLFGDVKDKYDVEWMVNIEDEAA